MSQNNSGASVAPRQSGPTRPGSEKKPRHHFLETQ
jgi:hypothetical protein